MVDLSVAQTLHFALVSVVENMSENPIQGKEENLAGGALNGLLETVPNGRADPISCIVRQFFLLEGII